MTAVTEEAFVMEDIAEQVLKELQEELAKVLKGQISSCACVNTGFSSPAIASSTRIPNHLQIQIRQNVETKYIELFPNANEPLPT